MTIRQFIDFNDYNNFLINETANKRPVRNTSGITVAFWYNPVYVAKIKTIKGHKWHLAEKNIGVLNVQRTF